MKRFVTRVLWLVLALAAMLALAGCVPATGTTTDTGPSSIYYIVILVAIFAIFYFLTIRPQRKRQKEQQKLIEELKKGDRVVTIGGIYGEVESTDEDSVTLKVESGTVRVIKGAIHHKISTD